MLLCWRDSHFLNKHSFIPLKTNWCVGDPQKVCLKGRLTWARNTGLGGGRKESHCQVHLAQVSQTAGHPCVPKGPVLELFLR